MSTLGFALWIVGVIFVVGGLVAVLRYRVVVGALLIAAGLALGLAGTVILD